MRPTELLDINIQSHCNEVHKRRYAAILDAVDAAITENKITVTALGRALKGHADEKHCIKRMDLLIGNYRLYSERNRYYQSMTYWLCSGVSRPVIQVDWSTLTSDEQWHLLRASLSFHGRAITLYEMVFKQKDYNKSQSHRMFLKQLRQVLPNECRPILVSDAGFKNPWFRAVTEMGWDWVGRVRGKVQITRPNESSWMPAYMLRYLIEPKSAYDIGPFLLAKTSPMECRMVAIKKPPQGRKHLNKKGQPARDSNSRVHARSQDEPWLLATSLTEEKPHQIINIYKQRMQIEEGFRDLKSPRFGLAMGYSGSKSLHRLANLILIASLALFALLLIGLTAERQQLHRRFQANTVRSRRVLSFVTLALRVIKRMPEFLLTPLDILEAQNDIHNYQSQVLA